MNESTNKPALTTTSGKPPRQQRGGGRGNNGGGANRRQSKKNQKNNSSNNNKGSGGGDLQLPHMKVTVRLLPVQEENDKQKDLLLELCELAGVVVVDDGRRRSSNNSNTNNSNVTTTTTNINNNTASDHPSSSSISATTARLLYEVPGKQSSRTKEVTTGHGYLILMPPKAALLAFQESQRHQQTPIVNNSSIDADNVGPIKESSVSYCIDNTNRANSVVTSHNKDTSNPSPPPLVKTRMQVLASARLNLQNTLMALQEKAKSLKLIVEESPNQKTWPKSVSKQQDRFVDTIENSKDFLDYINSLAQKEEDLSAKKKPSPGGMASGTAEEDVPISALVQYLKAKKEAAKKERQARKAAKLSKKKASDFPTGKRGGGKVVKILEKNGQAKSTCVAESEGVKKKKSQKKKKRGNSTNNNSNSMQPAKKDNGSANLKKKNTTTSTSEQKKQDRSSRRNRKNTTKGKSCGSSGGGVGNSNHGANKSDSSKLASGSAT